MLERLDVYTFTKDWIKADQQNWEILKQVGERNGSNYNILDSSELDSISCQVLSQIDQIWLENSNGQFGYTAQIQVLRSLNSSLSSDQDRQRFISTVGWDQDPNNYPKGHFPRRRTEFPSLLNRLSRTGCL